METKRKKAGIVCCSNGQRLNYVEKIRTLEETLRIIGIEAVFSPYIYERENGLLPVSVIDKSLDKRMASTIRHNRARGSHDVDLMSNIVKELHELGRSDAWISKHLGMDRDEILRLKQITGLAALFKDVKFGRAWQPVEEEEE